MLKATQTSRGLFVRTIYPTMGNRPGKYEIEILRNHGKPPLKLEASARIVNGNTVLSTRVNLRKLQPGHYSLGIRQPPWEWRYYPFAFD